MHHEKETFDLAQWLYAETFEENCIIDRAGFLKSPHNEISLLLRTANLRTFHLENAIEDLVDAEKDLTEFLIHCEGLLNMQDYHETSTIHFFIY